MSQFSRLLNKNNLLKIFDLLAKHNGKTRFIGGCVRDCLAGKEIKDIDLATDLLPEQVMSILTENGIRAIPTGLKFGTVTFLLEKDTYEITTLRQDISTNGRHAEVSYTNDWYEDAKRRDFTINAMSLDREGNIYDYFAGKEDLTLGVIRFVGNAAQRVEEDYLRILRYFRFLSYYSHDNIDNNALQACADYAHKLVILSGERIQNEMNKILLSPRNDFVLKLMAKHQILSNINIPNNLSFIEQANKCFSKLELDRDSWIYLALILRESHKFNLIDFSKRWALSNQHKNLLDNLLKHNYPLDDLLNKKILQGLVFIEGEKYLFEHLIVKLIETGNYYNFSKEDVIEFLDLIDHTENLLLPVTGNDIMELGVKVGPKVGVYLTNLKKIWLEKNFNLDRKQMLDILNTKINNEES